MFSGLFFASVICAHENRIAPVLPFGNISFIYPHPVRLIYLPRAGPTFACGWPSVSVRICIRSGWSGPEN